MMFERWSQERQVFHSDQPNTTLSFSHTYTHTFPPYNGTILRYYMDKHYNEVSGNGESLVKGYGKRKDERAEKANEPFLFLRSFIDLGFASLVTFTFHPFP